jgi:hypothetical protein
MRRLGLLLVSSLLSILPAAVGQAGPQKTLTIKLRSVVQTTTANDVEPKGPSAGDRVTVTDRLYNLVPQFGKPKGALVGRDTATVTVLAGNRGVDVRGVTRLPRGTIRTSGQISFGATSWRVPVVGGSGRFSGARGSVAVDEPARRGYARNIFRLILR